MAKGFKHGAGGGGASLNFKVVGGTSAPASPKENTVWVNTDVEITSWVFSVTEPENPSDGMVWISTGKTSPVAFNALKKNGIMVYPISAKQYVSGKWVSKEAKSYQNGAWVERIAHIFQSGAGAIQDLSYFNQTNGIVNVSDDAIVLGLTSEIAAYTNVAVRTSAAVDVSNFSSFVVDATCTLQVTDTWSGRICISKTAFNESSAMSDLASYTKFEADSERKKYTLDISTLTGEYYLGIFGGTRATIFNMYFE